MGKCVLTIGTQGVITASAAGLIQMLHRTHVVELIAGRARDPMLDLFGWGGDLFGGIHSFSLRGRGRLLFVCDTMDSDLSVNHRPEWERFASCPHTGGIFLVNCLANGTFQNLEIVDPISSGTRFVFKASIIRNLAGKMLYLPTT